MDVAAVHYKGDDAVVTFTGDLDIGTAPDIRTALLTAGEEKKHLIIDLDAVTFMDSTALGVFVGAMKRMRSTGGDVTFRNLPPRTRQLFSTTGLDRVLTIADDDGAATGEQP